MPRRLCLTTIIVTLAGADRTDRLTRDTEAHLKLLGEQTFFLFDHVCRPTDASALRAKFESDEVEVPSCGEMREAGLEQYYGNINMLMAEAWRGKILPSLYAAARRREELPQLPSAELLLVHEPSTGMLAGGIFISQLMQRKRPADASELPTPTDSALMIGIHRAPVHKMQKLLGATPSLNVTPAIVRAAQEWTAANQLATLYVCPLSGDGGALKARFGHLGFKELGARAEKQLLSDKRSLLLGPELEIREEVCQEAGIMAYRPPKAQKSREEL